jgi:lipoprotein-anchoring transpeptidase ErfK/SrfK
MVRYCILLIIALLFPALSSAGVLFEQHIGYEAARGDTLQSIGAQFGIDGRRIAEQNALDLTGPLRMGQVLYIATSTIIPKVIEEGIIIDVPGRMLYLFEDGSLVTAVPVGLGMPKGWETPAGSFTVRGKLKSPEWRVPKSIQEEMKREGLRVRESVPPGPKNPLGAYAILTTIPGIMIHETVDPSTVYQFMSHGCIRVLPEHMEHLFESVKDGMPGEIVYMPIKVAHLSDGRVFIEVHRDIYEAINDMEAGAKKILDASGLSGNVDWDKVRTVIREKAGVPVEVTR